MTMMIWYDMIHWTRAYEARWIVQGATCKLIPSHFHQQVKARSPYLFILILMLLLFSFLWQATSKVFNVDSPWLFCHINILYVYCHIYCEGYYYHYHNFFFWPGCVSWQSDPWSLGTWLDNTGPCCLSGKDDDDDGVKQTLTISLTDTIFHYNFTIICFHSRVLFPSSTLTLYVIQVTPPPPDSGVFNCISNQK